LAFFPPPPPLPPHPPPPNPPPPPVNSSYPHCRGNFVFAGTPCSFFNLVFIFFISAAKAFWRGNALEVIPFFRGVPQPHTLPSWEPSQMIPRYVSSKSSPLMRKALSGGWLSFSSIVFSGPREVTIRRVVFVSPRPHHRLCHPSLTFFPSVLFMGSCVDFSPEVYVFRTVFLICQALPSYPMAFQQ